MSSWRHESLEQQVEFRKSHLSDESYVVYPMKLSGAPSTSIAPEQSLGSDSPILAANTPRSRPTSPHTLKPPDSPIISVPQIAFTAGRSRPWRYSAPGLSINTGPDPSRSPSRTSSRRSPSDHAPERRTSQIAPRSCGSLPARTNTTFQETQELKPVYKFIDYGTLTRTRSRSLSATDPSEGPSHDVWHGASSKIPDDISISKLHTTNRAGSASTIPQLFRTQRKKHPPLSTHSPPHEQATPMYGHERRPHSFEYNISNSTRTPYQ
jgi:hypothetical protein